MKREWSGIWIAAAVAASGLAVSACATESYVDEHVAAVNTRVDGVSSRLDALGAQVNTLSGRVDAAERTGQEALQRADAAGKLAAGQFIYPVISTDDSVVFKTNSWKLSDEAQASLTAFAEKLKSDNKNVWIEIQGHGDPRGSVMHNRVLGEKRALEVRRFLAGQGVPAYRMTTVSWGEERPKNAETNAAANAENRRVVIIVTG